MQKATAIKVKSCKEMSGATSVMPVIRDVFICSQRLIPLSGLIPSNGQYAVIGCKLQGLELAACEFSLLSSIVVVKGF